MPVLDEQVVEGERQVPVDGRPVRRGRWARRRSCRTGPSPARSPRACAGGTSRSRRRGTAPGSCSRRRSGWAPGSRAGRRRSGSPAGGRASARSSPRRRRCVRRTVISRSLRDVQRRAGDRAVVGEHPQVGRRECPCGPGRSTGGSGHRRPAGSAAGRHLGQPGGVGGEQIVVGHGVVLPSRPRRRQGRGRPGAARECRVPGPDRPRREVGRRGPSPASGSGPPGACRRRPGVHRRRGRVR